MKGANRFFVFDENTTAQFKPELTAHFQSELGAHIHRNLQLSTGCFFAGYLNIVGKPEKNFRKKNNTKEIF